MDTNRVLNLLSHNGNSTFLTSYFEIITAGQEAAKITQEGPGYLSLSCLPGHISCNHRARWKPGNCPAWCGSEISVPLISGVDSYKVRAPSPRGCPHFVVTPSLTPASRQPALHLCNCVMSRMFCRRNPTLCGRLRFAPVVPRVSKCVCLCSVAFSPPPPFPETLQRALPKGHSLTTRVP